MREGKADGGAGPNPGVTHENGPGRSGVITCENPIQPLDRMQDSAGSSLLGLIRVLGTVWLFGSPRAGEKESANEDGKYGNHDDVLQHGRRHDLF